MKKLFTISLLFVTALQINAQTTIEYLDINNVKAGVLTRGDMFWNRDTEKASYEFPKGSGKHAAFAAALWIAGFDSSNTLHVAAQTYRQTGNDYWSGPLDNATDSITPAQSNLWDKIWKVNASTIDSFRQTSGHTLTNTPISILDWPARGNSNATGKNGINLSLNTTTDYAPFVDVNNDSIYNALNGDYPLIPGEQALWWVFNDDGGAHSESNGKQFHVEIQAMAHACNVTPLQNVTFYTYRLINKSNMPYHTTRLGIWTDADLGNYLDDYIGFDSISRMGICYNGTPNDNMYGTALTQTGIKILYNPGDSLGYQAPVGSFTIFSNGSINFPQPNTDYGFYNYLNGKLDNGSSFVSTCNGLGVGNPTNTIFKDDPSIVGGNSEKQCNNTPGDRRFVIASNDFNFAPNTSQVISFAVINTPLGSSNADFSVIRNLAAQVQQTAISCATPLAVSTLPTANTFQIFPNPSSTDISIKNVEAIDAISIFSLDGKMIYQTNKLDNKLQHTISTLAFANGNYILKAQSKSTVFSTKIIVQH